MNKTISGREAIGQGTVSSLFVLAELGKKTTYYWSPFCGRS
jgi:hypothetical protein